MKKMFTILCLCLFVISFLINTNAQDNHPKINPYLQIVLLDAAGDEMIDVYATLNEQYSFDDLRERTSFLPKKERQKEVVRILKEFSYLQQQAVLEYPHSSAEINRVSKIDILWAANTMVFSAVPEVIYYLAENFDEIYEIRYNPQIDANLLKDPTEDSQTFYPPVTNDNPPSPQPGLTLINAPAVWAAGDSGQGILVGNLDTGCYWNHPDLIHNIWNNLGEDADNDGHTIEYNGSTWVFDPGDINGVDDDGNGYVDDFIGWNFQSNNNNVNDTDGGYHGTHTSGIVCGDGTNGTQTGVAPKSKIMIFIPNGESQYWLAQQYALDKGVDIITSSLSYKWWFTPQPNYPMFRQMTDVELAAGVFHSNSTSNDGTNLGNAPIPYNISTPGNCPPSWIHPDQTLIGGLSSVTGVGNVNASNDLIVNSSPYGPATWEDIQANHPSYPYDMPLEYQDYPYETLPGSIGLIKPDVSAPGDGTVSTTGGGGYSSFSGTSGATPHVGGTAALLLFVNPNLTPADVSMILQITAVEKGAPGKDPRYGAGRIDAYAAYQLALSMVPVELSLFTASADENSITLNWSTVTETNNSGYEIERKTHFDERWMQVGFVPGFGTTTEKKNYEFTDVNLVIGFYSYRLKQIDFNGIFEYSNEVFAEVGTPKNFALFQNYPNPFNPSTTISWQSPVSSWQTLKIYDVLGNEVTTLVDEYRPVGKYEIEFNPASGIRNLASGIYIYQLKASGQNGTFVETKKMLLMK